MPASLNSTTHVRYGLLEKKLRADLDYEGVYRLLTDHEGYPKSICSHFQSAAKDPSYTCGGALAEMRSGQIRMWRGCPALDENYVEREYTLKNGGFTVGPVKTGIRPDRAGEVTRG
jgi:isopenicillin-N N-acyltransferase-like protein